MSKKLLKSTAVVSAMTFLSRISGLVRDVIMANFLGSGAVADAFFVAFRIPNFFRRIFGEGAFSQAFVPVYSELNERNTAEAKSFVSATAGRLGVIVFILSVLGVVFAPAIVNLFAPGYAAEAEKFDTTVSALRIMFPYLFFISLVAMSGSILNTLNRFAVPAATPVLLNLCFIATLVLFVPHAENAAQTLAYGVMVAGLIQLLFQIPALKKQGVLTMPSFSANKSTSKVFKLMVPAMFGVSVAQVNSLVNTILASFLVTGSVSWLYYSDRLMEFPVGVFGIALATVVLPSLSKEHQKGTAESFSAMMDWALRWVVMIALPAAVALAVLAVPLLATMFQYNAFKAYDVQQASLSLTAYAIGVVALVMIKVLAPGFYARQNTKTPVKIAAFAMVCNVVMSLIFVQFFQHAGLALALSLSAWANAMMLLFTLWREKIYTPQSGWFLYMGRICVAVSCMVAVLLWFRGAEQMWLEGGLLFKMSRLLLNVAAAVITYFAVLFILGVRPHQMLLLRPAVEKGS